MNLDTALWTAALFAALLRATAPVLLAALGGLVSERAGVVNVALEGLMLIAAFFGVMGSAWAAAAWPGVPVVWQAAAGAGLGLLAAVALALLLGFFHLELGADLIVTGIGINMLAAGLSVFLMVLWTGDKGSTAHLASLALPSLPLPGLDGWPLLAAFANGDSGRGHHVLVWLALLAVPAVYGLLQRTRLGLRLRAVGEDAEAAAAAGLSVKRLQYTALACSGLLAGLGGLYLSMGYLVLFQADMTAGRGFLALAAVFLGARRPLGTAAAALLFGAAAVLAAQLGARALPSQLVYMLPPLVTLLALVAFKLQARARRRRRAAAALAAWRTTSTTNSA